MINFPEECPGCEWWIGDEGCTHPDPTTPLSECPTGRLSNPEQKEKDKEER